jgi:small subunit ribosomal protein S6
VNRLYETMYVLHPDLERTKLDELITKFQHIVTQKGGEIVQVQEIGIQRLAYEVRGVREGYYVLMQFKGSTTLAKELERHFQITEGLLRYLTVRVH